MNNDHMQQAEKELSEEREMKLDFICKKCGSTEYEIKDKSNGTGIAHGLYCAKCGFWHKWIGKEELKRFSETKQKEKVYSVDEVNHLISEMDKVIAKLKTENAALRERLEEYKISFKKVYMDFFSKLNLDKDFRKRFDNVTLGCQITMFEDALDKAEARLAELKGEER